MAKRPRRDFQQSIMLIKKLVRQSIKADLCRILKQKTGLFPNNRPKFHNFRKIPLFQILCPTRFNPDRRVFSNRGISRPGCRSQSEQVKPDRHGRFSTNVILRARDPRFLLTSGTQGETTLTGLSVSPVHAVETSAKCPCNAADI
jgi:hypothetical protein